MSPGVTRILERAIAEAMHGQPDPLTCLMLASENEHGNELPDRPAALLAVMRAAGGSVVRWYQEQRRTSAETVALLEEALFQVQVGA